MSAATQYTLLLDKVSSRSNPEGIGTAYNYCMSKNAGLADNMLWAAAGGLPAFLLGSSMAKEEEKKKHKNYALAGVAAGFLGPKLVNAIIDPSNALPTVSGFDASDIKSLQLESLD